MRVLWVLFAVLAGYLVLWPVPIQPVAWQAPQDQGFTGAFASNQRLAALQVAHPQLLKGAEDIVVAADGALYLSVHDGRIMRMASWEAIPEVFADTEGRPLGMEFAADGALIVADAYRGLLSIDRNGQVQVLTQQVGDSAIAYADDLDIAADGTIYFSDASTKFGARAYGGSYPASLLDIMEHGGHGRLLRYDPIDGSTEVVLNGLEFANGVAMSADQQAVLVVETGLYRVLKVWVAGPRAGVVEIVIDNLPGFPDNINRGFETDTYWIGLVSPRAKALDLLSDYPRLRKVVQRLPQWLRPQAQAYGHVIQMDGSGRVLQSLQDPQGSYPQTTGVLETADYWYISSLTAAGVARLARNP